MHNTPEHALCSNFFSSAEITWAQSLVFITRGQCGLCECRNECEKNYLLHDTGIKKFYYSNDLKLFITLDENANILKLYNK